MNADAARGRIAAIIQARVGSSRLPGKVLRPIAGRPMLERLIERVRRARSIDEIIVATSTDAGDDAVAQVAAQCGTLFYRGDLTDVLDRYRSAAAAYEVDEIVRITADCPLIDPAVVDTIVEQHVRDRNDYTSNTIERSYPDGLDTEVVRREALEIAWREADDRYEREHVTPFFHRQAQRFRRGSVVSGRDLASLRWTVDAPEDLAFVDEIFSDLYPQNPEFGMDDILRFLALRPELCDLNGHLSVYGKSAGDGRPNR